MFLHAVRRRGRGALLVAGSMACAAAWSAPQGPLLINRQPLPGVLVTHTPHGQTVDRAALEQALGPLDTLLPGQEATIAVADLARALGAGVGAPPAGFGPTGPGAAQVDRALAGAWRQSAAAFAPLDGADPGPAMSQALDRQLDLSWRDLLLEPPVETFPENAVTLWLRPRVIQELRGAKEGDTVRLVMAPQGDGPLPFTLTTLRAHHHLLLCLFCEAAPGLSPPPLPGLASAKTEQTPLGLRLSLVLRPTDRPDVSLLPAPGRLLLRWPLRYHTVLTNTPHPCLTVNTVMDGDENGPLTYFHAVFNNDCPDYRLAVVGSSDRLGRPRDPEDIAKHNEALLLINGGYFDGQGMPIGVWRKGGALLSTGALGRTALLLKDGQPAFDRPKAVITLTYACGEEQKTLPLSRVNLPPRPDGYSLYTQFTHKGFGEGSRVFTLAGQAGNEPPFLVAGPQAPWGPGLCGAPAPRPGADGPQGTVDQPSPGMPPLPESGEEGKPFPLPDAQKVSDGQGTTDAAEEETVGDPDDEDQEESEEETGNETEEKPPQGQPPAVTLPVPLSVSVVWHPPDVGETPDMIEAGPRLVRGGVAKTEAPWENFNTQTGHFGPQRAPRTAIGHDPVANRTHFLVIAGRHDESRGTTLQETADLLLRLGATEAMNLDGGGSSAMVIKGVNVSFSPLLGARHFRRPVPSAVALLPLDLAEPPWDDAHDIRPYDDIEVPTLPDLSPSREGDTATPLPDILDGLKPVEDPTWKGKQ